MTRQQADSAANHDGGSAGKAAAIRVRLDEMLSQRGMTLTELSARVDVTVVNLSILQDRPRRVGRSARLRPRLPGVRAGPLRGRAHRADPCPAASRTAGRGRSGSAPWQNYARRCTASPATSSARATRSTWHWHQAPCRSPASRQQPGSASQGTARTGNLSTNHSRSAMRGRHEHGVQQLVLGESLHCSGGRAACDDQPAEAPHGHGDLCCERPGPAGFPDDEPEQEQH